MSRFAKNFHLTCAIIASFTCVLWWVVAGILLFYRRSIIPRPNPANVILFLIPSLLIGAGALAEFTFYNDERKDKTSPENGSLATSVSDTTIAGAALITTIPRALAAIVFTLFMLILGLRSLSPTRPYSLISLFPGLLPHWAVVLATIALYGFLAWILVAFARVPSKKEEKALLFVIFAVLLMAPIGVLLPKATLSLRFLQMLFDLVALLASISIFLSLHKDREEKAHQADGS